MDNLTPGTRVSFMHSNNLIHGTVQRTQIVDGQQVVWVVADGTGREYTLSIALVQRI
ncbi:hypothetical protein ABKN59_002505 [Abortiporus biennis]